MLTWSQAGRSIKLTFYHKFWQQFCPRAKTFSLSLSTIPVLLHALMQADRFAHKHSFLFWACESVWNLSLVFHLLFFLSQMVWTAFQIIFERNSPLCHFLLASHFKNIFNAQEVFCCETQLSHCEVLLLTLKFSPSFIIIQF